MEIMKKQYLWALGPLRTGACRFGARRGPLCGSFIGTGAVAQSPGGNNYPGATVPFGMVQLSPDTREAPDWGQASGYDYNDKTIFGFAYAVERTGA